MRRKSYEDLGRNKFLTEGQTQRPQERKKNSDLIKEQKANVSGVLWIKNYVKRDKKSVIKKIAGHGKEFRLQ